MTDTTRRPGDAPTGEAPFTTTIRPTSRTTAPGTHGGLPEDVHGDRGPEGADGTRPDGTRLLPDDHWHTLSEQLQHAVAGFVDAPRDSVEQADHVLEELAARLTDAVTERRRTLRRSWRTADGGEGPDTAVTGTGTDTEQLRLALRDYRGLAERLLRV
ncbi:hypothetical protein JL475_20300 [Streptomyces sp. M2CJ-2]|uniref:hypothetical protein n=1 Tax=Streptomyces sp. M2CJ-2 TaxID=2803948 RepID=UPI001927A972|nr:hypothetical protein [Streptomyces sp. M2CJ-2]MBL3668291.1 hypothetical protein [Streptomyces sp. M2CJ-2]